MKMVTNHGNTFFILALTWFAIVIGLPDTCHSAEKLFPTNLPKSQWAEFTAAGFPQPVAHGATSLRTIEYSYNA